MKTKTLLLVLMSGFILNFYGQKPTTELTFTAENNGQNVVLDSIFIENLSQGGDTTIYAPDTVLILDYFTGISNNEAIMGNTFSVSQNYPNPFKDQTTINICLHEKEKITITIRDILGRELDHFNNILKRGNHSFNFYPGNERYYLLTATGKRTSKTIKMLNVSSSTSNATQCKIVYNKHEDNQIGLKSSKAILDFVFTPGDELRYTGYAQTVSEINGSDVIEDTPQTNELYEFEITEGIPCPETPTFSYEGQVYNTVLIGNQCWMKENLNAGTMIYGSQEMGNNGILEKYCFNDEMDNCNIYGGLYQWHEMMQYTTTQGTQGICPPDWHLPTDEEWKQIEGEADSQYGYPDPEWDNIYGRGFDVGLNLKSISSLWFNTGNGVDLYGFEALPGGCRSNGGTWDYNNYAAFFWSSTEGNNNTSWFRRLFFESDQSARGSFVDFDGFSVRCLKD